MALPDDLRVRVMPSGASEADEVPVRSPGPVSVSGLVVTVEDVGDSWHWSVANEGASPIALDSVSLVADGGAAGAEPRLFSNGYQSWSPTRTLRLGIDTDPSRDPRPIPLVRAAFHADPGVAADGELRSEQVTILADGNQARLLVGFDGGASHAGTLRARRVGDRVEVAAQAWLGGARLGPGEQRRLHPVVVDDDTAAGPDAMLERFAARVGATEHARTGAPFQVGWCSWYQYFHEVSEGDVLANLELAADWPFEVFQLDDGYQRAIGDWLRTNERFPGGVDRVAEQITRRGHTPGIWIAPFLVAPDSEIARSHPDWLARAPEGDGPAIGMYHEIWGGIMWQLDTTNPAVVDHLEKTAAALVDAGYRYLKLDFTFSAAMPARCADASATPAERVRRGFEAIRRGAGDDVFILGCGAPIGAVVGVVDGMRIGADVAPWWHAPADAPERQPAYEATTPATQHAFVNTCTRNFLHRRWWLNDPDCVMLRTSDTRLSPDEARAWAWTIGASGGMVLVSDDLGLVRPDERRLFDEVVAAGRAADDAARRGGTARATGLLDPDGPTGLVGPEGGHAVDLARGEAPATVRAVRSGAG